MWYRSAQESLKIEYEVDPTSVLAFMGSKIVAQLYFRVSSKGDTVRVEDLEVDPEFRNRGIAKEMYRQLQSHMRQTHPAAETIGGKIMSQYALKARNSVFGEPSHIHNEEVLSALPDIHEQHQGGEMTYVEHYLNPEE